jgi:hypothetical protein
VSKPCSYATSPLPVLELIMKQAMIRLRLGWIAKVSALGSTEPHRIHSTLVGYHNPTFLASSGRLHSAAAPRACSACDTSRTIHDRLAVKLIFHICACIDQVGQAVQAAFSQAAGSCLSFISVYILWVAVFEIPACVQLPFSDSVVSIVLCISSLSF